jgi:hypothetical protein
VDEVILSEIDVDERFMGEGYAVPPPEGVAAIREAAQSDGVFIGPVYTGKGLRLVADRELNGRRSQARVLDDQRSSVAASSPRSPSADREHLLVDRVADIRARRVHQGLHGNSRKNAFT